MSVSTSHPKKCTRCLDPSLGSKQIWELDKWPIKLCRCLSKPLWSDLWVRIIGQPRVQQMQHRPKVVKISDLKAGAWDRKLKKLTIHGGWGWQKLQWHHHKLPIPMRIAELFGLGMSSWCHRYNMVFPKMGGTPKCGLFQWKSSFNWWKRTSTAICLLVSN